MALNVVVVGAGLGGLAAAVVAASAGWQVLVVERDVVAGGKVGTVVCDGVEFDTGPSVLTLPGVLDEVLLRAGMRLGEHLTLRRPNPGFRYHYADGVVLDIEADLEGTLANVETTLGASARDELRGFLTYAAGIWKVSETPFLRGERPSWHTLLRMGRAPDLLAIDPFRTMNAAIQSRVREPHLRALLQRYATYNGSDVRRAPAALNSIAHVELAMGGFGVEGGMVQVARVLAAAATRLGVEFRYGAAVERVRIHGGVVQGVELDSGGFVPAQAVVWNGEFHMLGRGVLPGEARKEGTPDSTSGWTAVFRSPRRRGGSARVAHTVVFPPRYEAEFEDLFDGHRVPRDPTVYLCAQEVCHGRPGWVDDEPVFVMVNAPCQPADRGSPEGVEAAVRHRLGEVGLLGTDDTVVWTRTPADLATRFPGSGGALYGSASNGAMSAFLRPANRFPGVAGLYVCGGSTHPGGGMPLVMLSGQLAARLMVQDFGGMLPALPAGGAT